MIEQKTAPATSATDADQRLLTSDEVAAWLGIRRCTLEKSRSMRLGNYPPYVKIGRVVRYRRSDVEAWLLSNAFNVDGSPVSSGTA